MGHQAKLQVRLTVYKCANFFISRLHMGALSTFMQKKMIYCCGLCCVFCCCCVCVSVFALNLNSLGAQPYWFALCSEEERSLAHDVTNFCATYADLVPDITLTGSSSQYSTQQQNPSFVPNFIPQILPRSSFTMWHTSICQQRHKHFSLWQTHTSPIAVSFSPWQNQAVSSFFHMTNSHKIYIGSFSLWQTCMSS